MAAVFRQLVRGAAGVEHPSSRAAGHFLQEDAGGRLGAAILVFIEAHPAR